MNPLIRYFKSKYNLLTEDEIINTLVTTKDDNIYDLLLRTDFLTPGMIRNIFINTKSSNILLKIINNPKCPSNVLEKIYSYITTVDIISDHPLEKIAKSFSRSDYQIIIEEIINNPNCPVSILRDLLLQYKTSKGKNFYVTDSNGKINHDIIIVPNIMREVFKSPLLSEEDLEPFYDFSFANDILRNPKCSKKVLNRLSHSVNEDDIYKALDNPNCPEELLVGLYETNKLRDTNIISSIFSHPNFPKDMILYESYSSKLFDYTLLKAINNKEFSEDEIRVILFNPIYRQSFKIAIILSRHCSNELLLEFLKLLKPDEYILIGIAKKLNLPASVQELLLYNSNRSVRYELASNPTCQEGILIKLSKDKDKLVRSAVITNPNCPIEILFDLMNNGYDDYFEKKSYLRGIIFKNKHLTLKHIFTFFESDLSRESKNTYNSEELEILFNLIMSSDSSIEISELDIEMLKKYLDIDFSHVEKSLSKTQKKRVSKQKIDNFVRGNLFNKFTSTKKQNDDVSVALLQSEEKRLKEQEETLINTAVNAIKTLGNSVIELEKLNNFDAAKKFYHSAVVPNEVLYIQVGEHYEIRPDLIPYLKFINLHESYVDNLIMSGVNWSETNIRFDPQTVYNKDLSNTIIGNHNVRAGVDFSGANLQNSDISDVEMPTNLDFAITNESTVLPYGRNR